jgi:hypothetical protein
MALLKTWRQLTKFRRRVIMILLLLAAIVLLSRHTRRDFKSQLFNLMKEKHGKQWLTSVPPPGPECTIGIIIIIIIYILEKWSASIHFF